MKLMKTYLLIFSVALFGITFPANAQSLSPEVISSGGDFFTYPNGTLSWTLGEPVIETIGNQTVTLTQGFHQPIITITAIKEPLAKDYHISVYPNPAIDFVNISLDNGIDEVVSVQLYDMKGARVINERFISDNIIQLDLSALAASNYLLSLRRLNGELITTYQINKNR